MFSALTQAQFRRFRSVRRAWISLWLLLAAFIISLFSEQIANDRPLCLSWKGNLYFPTLRFYAGETFGGEYRTEADYKKLRALPSFQAEGGWMIFPLIPYDPLKSHLDLSGHPPHPPSRDHWLGTDNSARDVLARLLYGFRLNMLFAFTLMLVSAVLGTALGGLQGYLGGRTDLALQRIIEIWSALPFLYVVILLGSIYGQGFGILLLVFALFEWIGLSYYTRAEFFRLKNQAFILAARTMGVSHSRIIWRHILPNALNPVVTLLPFTLITSVSALTALDFLGFGLPPPSPSWGEMLQQGLQYLDKPWLAISSVTALFVTLLLASFIGEGARAAFDPKANNRVN
jgi:microcin C transport system permease protein